MNCGKEHIGEEGGGNGGAEAELFEESEVEERFIAFDLPNEESGEENDGEGKASHDPGRGPAELPARVEPVDEKSETGKA